MAGRHFYFPHRLQWGLHRTKWLGFSQNCKFSLSLHYLYLLLRLCLCKHKHHIKSFKWKRGEEIMQSDLKAEKRRREWCFKKGLRRFRYFEILNGSLFYFGGNHMSFIKANFVGFDKEG